MFTDILLDSSPNRGPWLTRRVGRISSLAALAAFALGAEVTPRLPWFPSSWSWLEGGVACAFAALFYSLMVFFVVADARRVGLRPGGWGAAVLLLNVPGFVGYLISAARRTGDWRRIALPLAYSFEALLLAFCVAMPLVSTAALGRLSVVTPVPPPPLGSGRRAKPPARRVTRRPVEDSILRAPNQVPRVTVPVTDAPNPAADADMQGPIALIPGGDVNGVPYSSFGGGESVPRPPDTGPAKPSGPVKRIVQSQGVEMARLIYGPKPEYPRLAIMTRTEGTVRLKAIIGQDGTIQDLKVLDGPPLLVNAAVQAVGRWRYQPTLLNQQPVEVETEIEVKFKLAE